MRKSQSQIIKDKLSSNLRKSKVRSDRAEEALSESKRAPDAGSKRGKAVIRHRERAAAKAAESLARHSRASLDHETDIVVRQRGVPLRQTQPRRM